MNSQTVPQLSANLVWLFYLKTVRNDTMHAKEKTDIEKRNSLARICDFIFVDTSGIRLRYDRVESEAGGSRHEKNVALREDILLALDALEGKTALGLRGELKAV